MDFIFYSYDILHYQVLIKLPLYNQVVYHIEHPFQLKTHSYFSLKLYAKAHLSFQALLSNLSLVALGFYKLDYDIKT